MRNEIKIPIDKNFNSYFDKWKDFENKISRPYKDRYISNIYYDENFKTAKDNLSGISNRRKYRIRWYDNKFHKHTYEIKIKKNNLGKKISLMAEGNKHLNIENLFSFNNEFLKKKENKFFLEHVDSFDLEPQIQVNYLRSYFLYEGKIRITFDQKINYLLVNKFNFYQNKVEDSMNVIEIKFSPENTKLALELIKDSKFVPKRFSKYLRGLYLMGIANYI
jgi:hypothetical protein